MDSVILEAYKASSNGKSYAFATIIEASKQGTPRKPGAKMVVLADGSCFGTIGGGLYEKKTISACLKAIKTCRPSILTFSSFGKPGQGVCGGRFRIFVEPFKGARRLIILGAGHIGLQLSFLGKLLNFEVTIIDNRKAWATRKRFPHVDNIIIGQPSHILRKIHINKDCFIFVATYSHTLDLSCLKSLIHTSPTYVGLIGSKQKRELFLRALRPMKASKEFINSLSIPAGLDIGSQTPEEIAISVSAEIIKKYNKLWVKSNKFKGKKEGGL